MKTPHQVRTEIVNEVKRLAESPDNRHPGTCSRDFFRTHSSYSEHAVIKHFGNFGELLREARLAPSRTSSRYDARTALLQEESRIVDYINTEVMPWVNTQPSESTDGLINIVVGSDFHGYHVNRFALDVFLKVVEMVQPQHVALAGDVFDFAEPSRWSQNPNKLLDLQGEIDFGRTEILKATRDRVPDSDIKLYIGNHEYRLIRYLAERAPALASLRCLSFNQLLGLDDLGIDLVFGGSTIAPTAKLQREVATKNYYSYHDLFTVTHGTSTGNYPPINELKRFGRSGCSGHVHRAQTATTRTLDRGLISWHTLGMMCENDPPFCGGLPTEWTTGFGVVTINPEAGTTHFRHVLIENGTAFFDGHYFRQ